MRLLHTILTLVLLASCRAAPAASPESAPSTFAFERGLLGTRFELLICHQDAEVAAAAAEAAFGRVRELDRILSDYDPESELRQLTRAGAGTHRISPDLHAVLVTAMELSTKTGGAFDVTAGPLTRLWRRARRRGELPDEEAIAAALSRTGAADWSLAMDATEVALERDDMALDLGGLAKGYVLDEVLELLTSHGISSALVDGGGDLAASGPPPGRDAWLVTLADLPGLPSSDGDQLTIPLVHGALCTSGDSFQRLELDGTVHSHLIDPRTGRALTNRAAATVLAPTAMLADGLASACCVLTPEASLELLAEFSGTSARLGRGAGADLKTWTTSDFPTTVVE